MIDYQPNRRGLKIRLDCGHMGYQIMTGLCADCTRKMKLERARLMKKLPYYLRPIHIRET